MDEEGEGIEIIGEIEEFPPDETREATFELEPSSYVLVCNVVAEAGEHGGGEEEGEHMGGMEVHYKMGMFTALTVE